MIGVEQNLPCDNIFFDTRKDWRQRTLPAALLRVPLRAARMKCSRRFRERIGPARRAAKGSLAERREARGRLVLCLRARMWEGFGMREPSALKWALATGGARNLARSYLNSLVLLVVGLGLIGGLRASGYAPVAIHDSTLYLSIGRMWAKGFVPYTQIFDHHPPVIHVVTAIGYLLTPESPAGFFLVFSGLLVGACISWVWIARTLFGSSSGTRSIGTELFVIVVIALLVRANYQFIMLTEGLAWCFSSMALACALQRGSLKWAAAAGSLMALALLSKQQIAADALAMAVLLVAQADTPWRRLFAAAAGGIGVVVVTVLLLAVQGNLADAIYCVFVYPLQITYYVSILAEPFQWIGYAIDFPRLRPIYLSQGAIVVIGLAGLAMRMWREKDFRARGSLLIGALLLWLWVSLELAVISETAHYFVMTWAPCLMLGVIGTGHALRALGGSRATPQLANGSGASTISIGIAAAVIATWSFAYFSVWQPAYNDRPRWVDKVNSQLKPTDQVLVYYGEPSRWWRWLGGRPLGRWIYVPTMAFYTPQDHPIVLEFKRDLEQFPDAILVAKASPAFYFDDPFFKYMKGRIDALVATGRYDLQQEPGVDFYHLRPSG